MNKPRADLLLRIMLVLVIAGVLSTGIRVTVRSAAAPPQAVTTLPAAPGVGVAIDAVPTPERTVGDPPAPPSPVPSPEPAPTPLSSRLAEALADPALEGTAIGFFVVDDAGAVSFARAPEAPLLPASAQKLTVAAAALATMGPGYRYTTRVAAGAPLADGIVDGDLVLVGSGDPALVTPTFQRDIRPLRPATSLATLADAVVAAGVRHVRGGVIGNSSIFPEEPVASGWLERYFTELDATLVSGLTVDAGRKLFFKDGRVEAEAAPDPASEAAAALYTLLRQRGVQIDGGVGVQRHQAPPAHVLGEIKSPPMAELVRYFTQRSDNHMADAIFRTIGLHGAGEATWAGAARATMQALEPLGLDWRGSVLADGSGLSRHDRLTAMFLAQLNRVMVGSPAGALWDASMAVAGESGTLQRRLVGTLGAQRLRGKTGSLEDVRTLVGSIEGPGGDRYHFALLINGLRRGQTAAARNLQDRLVLILAEDLHQQEGQQ